VFDKPLSEYEIKDGIYCLKLTWVEQIQNNFSFLTFVLYKIWYHGVLGNPTDLTDLPKYVIVKEEFYG